MQTRCITCGEILSSGHVCSMRPVIAAPLTPEPSSAREWWVSESAQPNIAGKMILHTASSEQPQNPGWTRVIEYAAFEQMRKERDELSRLVTNDTAFEEKQSERIAELTKERDRYREALEKIGAVDMPSAADKTAWIVMLESICLLARKALKEKSE